MGLLDVFRKRPVTTVRVSFRDLSEPPPRGATYGYVYTWSLPFPPQVGYRVLVPGMDGPAWSIVTGVDDATANERRMELKTVIRTATAEELAKAAEAHNRDKDAWLNQMRKAAGLPTKGRLRKAPAHWPSIPPADGTAPPQEAGRYGAVWWRAYKEARNNEEAQRFKSLGHRWYAIQKRGH